MGTYIAASLRTHVHTRAGGCCEYCRIPDALTFAHHEIDHIIAQKHGGKTEADNLALCCTLCNKYKGTDIASLDPDTGELVRLFHPRQQKWSEHFQVEGARFIALTPVGKVTIALLQLNHRNRVEERRLLITAGLFSLKGAKRI